MMEAIQQAEQDLRDYRWMADRIAEYYARNTDDEIKTGIARYGIEASLPRAAYRISDPSAREAQKRLREYERINRYEEKLRKIDEAVASLTDERERVVAEGLMDGEKLYMIAQQIGVSRQTIYDIKRSMVRSLAISMYGDRIAEET